MRMSAPVQYLNERELSHHKMIVIPLGWNSLAGVHFLSLSRFLCYADDGASVLPHDYIRHARTH